jgi:hypothetical protein
MIEELIIKVKEKKELADLEDNFVKTAIKEILKEFPLTEFNPRSKKTKEVIKKVRAKLRRTYGLFRENVKIDNIDNIEQVLKKHSSTKERFAYYSELYTTLFKITGKVKTILDLGAGLNPFSYNYLGFKPEYYAYDLGENEVNLINLFFEKNKIKGKAEVKDITKHIFSKADIAFLFKMTEVIDQNRGHKRSEDLIKKLPVKYVVISFPTLTMSGKPMKVPERKWVQLMAERLNYDCQKIVLPNEIFYLITK